MRMVGSANVTQDQRKTTARHKGSDEETIRYIKRILCASPSQNDALTGHSVADSKPLEELLPPLTSSNDIDLQLYAIIAVILSNFVQTWYNRITPDQDFVAEVVQIIAHCTRGLEQRLRQVDLEDLFLDEIPALLTSHVDGRPLNPCPSAQAKLTRFVSRESRSTRMSRARTRARHPNDLSLHPFQCSSDSTPT